MDADEDSGVTMSRGKVKELALKLGYGLRNHVFLPLDSGNGGGGSGGPGQPWSSPKSRQQLDRGDMVMFLSANTMSWPALVYGYVLLHVI